MRIHSYGQEVIGRLHQSFEEHGLVYGAAKRYASLLAPASVYLTATELLELEADVVALASLYRDTTALYLASRRGNAPPWITDAVEHGLSPAQAQANRLVAEAGFEPMLTRVDYVDVSSDRRQVAEVQWKSGGPGFFYGHEAAYRDVCPIEPSTAIFGDLATRYFDTFISASPEPEIVIVNEARAPWLKAEAHLVEVARTRGVTYLPLDRSALSQQLLFGGKQLAVSLGDLTRTVTVLRGRGFTDVLDEAAILRIAVDSIEGRTWVEAPLNFIYRQKWNLSLPFLPAFQHLFDARLRSILIPTTLIVGELIDLTPLAPGFPSEHRDRLVSITSLHELLRLPASLRARFVVKCGAGAGELHNGGHGVFRLGGSKANAATVLNMVRSRVSGCGEPWIIQSYANHRYDVPLALPGDNNPVQLVKAHARIMLFAGRAPTNWKLHGAIANFGKSWKVTGAKAGTGRDGELLGSAFTDVRLEVEPAGHASEAPTLRSSDEPWSGCHECCP